MPAKHPKIVFFIFLKISALTRITHKIRSSLKQIVVGLVAIKLFLVLPHLQKNILHYVLRSICIPHQVVRQAAQRAVVLLKERFKIRYRLRHRQQNYKKIAY
jgi:hypothetical protein